MKTLLTLAALLLIYWIIRQQWRRLQGSATKQQKTEQSVKQMVPCAHCGLYLPKEEAIARNGMFYCCPEHRDASANS